MYVVVRAPRELTVVRMFCGGTMFGLVNATAVWPVASPTIALATEIQLSERCGQRSEEHTSELQSLMRISYAVFCLKKTTRLHTTTAHTDTQFTTSHHYTHNIPATPNTKNQ